MEEVRQFVWYIEARDYVAPPGYAPADPQSMGSAVAVELETQIPDGTWVARKYLLTCGHVVRKATAKNADGWGPRLMEVCCFRTGTNYLRTIERERRSNVHQGAYLADVHPFSPYSTLINESVPELERLAPNDWVLLDVKDRGFQLLPAVRVWAVGRPGMKLGLVGYPGGAGTARNPVWKDFQAFVMSPSPREFTLEQTDFGTLTLSGAETREGMSGGGYFSVADGALLGIHRSSRDEALARYGISIEHIRDELEKKRMRPVPRAAAPKGQAHPLSHNRVMTRSVSLTGDQLSRLRAGLLTIYTTAVGFRGMLSRIGQSYDVLETGNLTYEENMLAIVQKAAAGGWIMDLIGVALQEVQDAVLLGIQKELRPLAIAATADPFLVCRLTGSNVMVDRADLRKHLRAMADPLGKRLLVVKGPRKSGRTHTVQLLSYLEQERGTFSLTSIDLETFGRVAGVSVSAASNTSPIQITTSVPHGFTASNSVYVDGVKGNRGANGLWEVTITSPTEFVLNGSNGDGAYISGGTVKLQTPVEAWHIAEKLIDLLLYDASLVPDPPTDAQWARWVQRFCDRFEGYARQQQPKRAQQNLPLQVWIVIDAFHTVLLAQSSVDLIRELANRINTTLHHFRMVLLGFEDTLPAQVGNHLEEEAIGAIGEDQIIEFVGLALNQMQVPVDDERVAEVVFSVLSDAPLDDPEFLMKLGPAASRELQKVENNR